MSNSMLLKSHVSMIYVIDKNMQKNDEIIHPMFDFF